MRLVIFFILQFFFIHLSSLAQQPEPKIYGQVENEKIGNYTYIFFIDENTKSTIPVDLKQALKTSSGEQIDDIIISYFGSSDKYQNVDVKQYLNKETKEHYVLIDVKKIKKIQNIKINGLNLNEQVFAEKKLILLQGKYFKSYLIEGEKKQIEQNIYNIGYPNGVVKSFQVKTNISQNIDLTYNVEKGEPCRIEQVIVENSNSNLLNFINLPIETGSICDIGAVQQKLSEIKINYWRDGYMNAIAFIKEVQYSKNKDRAKFILRIDRGKKTFIKISDEYNRDLSFDFSNESKDISYSDILLSNDEDINSRLTKHYLDEGYPFVRVEGPEKITNANGDLTLHFKVKKGSYVFVKEIYFIGDLPENKDKIVEELGLKKTIFSSKIPFVQSKLEDYRDALQSIYFRYGYADAQVSLPDFNYVNNGSAVNLVFSADSGEKYKVVQLRIDHLPENFVLNENKLSANLKIGDVLNFEKKTNYINEVKKQLLEKGYLYTKLKIKQSVFENDEGVKSVSLVLNVDTGPVVRVRKIYASGDLYGKEKEIISLSGIETNDIFTQALLDKARTRILRHELFSTVVVEPLIIDAIEKREENIDIMIRTRGREGFLFTLAPGWGSLRGYRFRVDYSLNNITRDGLRLVSNLTISQEKQQLNFDPSETRQILGQQVNLGLSEPLFSLGPIFTPFDVSLVAGYQVVAETLSNREYQTLKLVNEWKPEFFDYNWNFSTSFLHEKSTSTSNETTVIQAIDSPSIVVREFLQGVSFDSRNNFGWPTSGMFVNAQYGMARFGFGSDVQFDRLVFDENFFFPIFRQLSGALSFGGVFVSDAHNSNGQTVTPPASRRATLMDNALIRGFPETFGSAAPGPLMWIHYAKNGGSNCNTQLASVGGTGLVYLKSEARLKLSDLIGAVVFMDTGENYLSKTEVSQINRMISQNLGNIKSSSATQCVVDKATLIAPSSLSLQSGSLLQDYWDQAYASVGVGLRLILGNYASLSLDYGYPIKDPSSRLSDCVSPPEALASDKAPKCVSRIQSTEFDIYQLNIKFTGALHLGIGAQF